MATIATLYPSPGIPPAVAEALSNANDRPRPAEDAARTAQKYAVMAQEFRSGAWRHLEEGDLAQASNKAWGMVAETVKAIRAWHGSVIHTHRSIMEEVVRLRRLVADAGDAETANWIGGVFLIASKLHSNFYEDELHPDIVLGGLIECEQLMERLYGLFWPDGSAA